MSRFDVLRTRPWNEPGFDAPRWAKGVPGMLWDQEKRMLYWLAREWWSGRGCIADLGSFLGGSAACLAAGLPERGRPIIHSYDLFRLGIFERSQSQYFPDGPPEGGHTRSLFESYLRDHLDRIVIHEGDILSFSAPGPVEILFVDVAKSYRVMDHLLLNFFPALCPGTSLVILQDYLSPETGPWHHVVMERLANAFEYLVDCDRGSALFAVRADLTPPMLQGALWVNIPDDEKLSLMDRAIEKVGTEEKRELLQRNRALLVDGRHLTWGMHYHSLRR